MKIIFIKVMVCSRPRARPFRRGLHTVDQYKVFAPIADPGQLAHQSATHSNALVDNPFEDGAEAAAVAGTEADTAK